MNLHELSSGVIKVRKKRVGRGLGSGRGKTCGRGHKGSKSRSGYKSKIVFEGGQTPLNRRLPKFGFKNPNKVFFQIVNINSIESDDRILSDMYLTKDKLKSFGFIKSHNKPVKLLAKGNLSKKLIFTVDAASSQAVDLVSQCGGKVMIQE